jgi:hypothetical protein
MIRKAIYTLILLVAIAIANLSAQNSQVLNYMNLPQNHLINPAFRPSNSVYIGLPVISGISLNIKNNFVNFSDVFKKGQYGDSVISILHLNSYTDNFISKIKDNTTFEPRVIVQLFGLGFSLGNDGYLFLDINDRVDGSMVIPRDLFALVLKGNDQFVGKRIDLSSLRGDMKYYREIGFGFSKYLTTKFRIGLKGKLLYGIAGISIENRSFGISISKNYTHKIDADLLVNVSAPVKFNINSDHSIQSIILDEERFKTSHGLSNFLSGKNNRGLGLDFGATYDISDRLMISAAITDIGYIRWGKDVSNLLVKSRFEFGGLNVVDVINGTKTFEDLGDELADSLNNAFSFTRSGNHFTEKLHSAVTLGASYCLTKSFSLGVVSYNRILNKQAVDFLTFSANLNLNNRFSSSLSYTIAKSPFNNLGAGIAFRAGIFQFYILSDRIPLMWDKIKIDKTSSVLIPASWNTVNLQLGVNLVFGSRNNMKGDKPMILLE